MRPFHPDARVLDAETGALLTPEMIDAAQHELTGAGPVFLPMPATLPAVARYLAALRVGRPVLPLDPDAGHTELIGRYATGDVHPELALLLTTSGSTGDPKLVRLSKSGMLANADQIVRSLGITGDDVAITTLPLHYSYGLSVLNSYLYRGATVVLERGGLLRPGFWTAVDRYGVTSLALVPYQYEMLRRLRFDPARHPALRTLTQAGGRLRTDLVGEFAATMAAAGGRLYVMYGQTEAGPRMAVLPPERIVDKLGSVGRPVPGGAFAVDGDEVVYRGPNVMMGYARTAADLALGDQAGGVLRTGDLGRLDDEGFLFLTGRARRFAKVFGVRVNLDDVERQFPVAAVAGDDRLRVFAEGLTAEQAPALRTRIAQWLGTHVTGVQVCPVEALPLLPNGKTDYRALEVSR